MREQVAANQHGQAAGNGDLAEPIALEVAESFDPIDAALTKSESTFRSPRMFDNGRPSGST